MRAVLTLLWCHQASRRQAVAALKALRKLKPNRELWATAANSKLPGSSTVGGYFSALSRVNDKREIKISRSFGRWQPGINEAETLENLKKYHKRTADWGKRKFLHAMFPFKDNDFSSGRRCRRAFGQRRVVVR